MDVNKEIERKFLLRSFPKIEGDSKEYRIKQWYTPDGLRYRFQVNTKTKDVSIFKTIFLTVILHRNNWLNF